MVNLVAQNCTHWYHFSGCIKKIRLRRAVFTIFLILHLKIALSGHFWWLNVKKIRLRRAIMQSDFTPSGPSPLCPKILATWLIIIILLYIVLSGIVSEKKLW